LKTISKNTYIVSTNPSADGFYAIACGRLYFFSEQMANLWLYNNFGALNKKWGYRNRGRARKKIAAVATCTWQRLKRCWSRTASWTTSSDVILYVSNIIRYKKPNWYRSLVAFKSTVMVVGWHRLLPRGNLLLVLPKQVCLPLPSRLHPLQQWRTQQCAWQRGLPSNCSHLNLGHQWPVLLHVFELHLWSIFSCVIRLRDSQIFDILMQVYKIFILKFCYSSYFDFAFFQFLSFSS